MNTSFPTRRSSDLEQRLDAQHMAIGRIDRIEPLDGVERLGGEGIDGVRGGGLCHPPSIVRLPLGSKGLSDGSRRWTRRRWTDRKSTRLNSSHYCASRMPSSA